MPPLLTNFSDEVDSNTGWKTYYIKIYANDETYFKIGMCKGSVKYRFRKEAQHLKIEILKMWRHDTEINAYNHEQILVSQYPGDRPYIGQCGPFQFGGNTEVYSHDVIGGEPPPRSFVAKLYTLGRSPLLAKGYPERNPLLTYKHLYGQVRYMGSMWGPPDFGEDVFLQVPLLSSPQRVTLATVDFLEDGLRPERPSNRLFPKKLTRDTLERNITVRSWYDYGDMRFEGAGFKITEWDDWC